MIRKWELLVREAKQQSQLNNILEIGCCPFPLSDPLAECYGLSTLKFGEYLNGIGKTLTSCDIDPEHVQNASTICQQNNVKVDFHIQDGKDFLRKWEGPIDFLYLDNASDPKITFEQFQIAESKLIKNWVVVLDDCHSDEWGIWSKGTLTLPYVLDKGYDVKFYGAYSNSIMVTIRPPVTYIQY